MKQGGYHIVDFGSTNISSTEGATIKGIYESIEGSLTKAILISGVVIDNVEHRDTFVDVTTGDNAYTFSAYGKSFSISSEDAISLT